MNWGMGHPVSRKRIDVVTPPGPESPRQPGRAGLQFVASVPDVVHGRPRLVFKAARKRMASFDVLLVLGYTVVS